MTSLLKPNPIPFWKEKSLSAVWKRLNSGAKMLVHMFCFVLIGIGIELLLYFYFKGSL